MNENIGRNPQLNRNSEEAFTYNRPLALRCISDERYKSKKDEIGSLKEGKEYYAIGECRDHFVIGVPVILMENSSGKVKMGETMRFECVAPKCRFEVI